MYPKTFFANNRLVARAGKCFVLMPFAPEFDDVYETIREALESPETGLLCSRAKDILNGGHIIEDVLRQIAISDVILADLTGQNPNVFYELGIAQMVKDVNKILLLTQDPKSVPFDVQEYRWIVYERTIRGGRELAKTVSAAAKAAAERIFRFTVSKNEPFDFKTKLPGADRCGYDFTISECMPLFEAAKFIISVRRHIVGQAPQTIFNDSFMLSQGEKVAVPGSGWDLMLEGATEEAANFAVLHQG